jgi:hypothetical protein
MSSTLAHTSPAASSSGEGAGSIRSTQPLDENPRSIPCQPTATHASGRAEATAAHSEPTSPATGPSSQPRTPRHSSGSDATGTASLLESHRWRRCPSRSMFSKTGP